MVNLSINQNLLNMENDDKRDYAKEEDFPKQKLSYFDKHPNGTKDDDKDNLIPNPDDFDDSFDDPGDDRGRIPDKENPDTEENNEGATDTIPDPDDFDEGDYDDIEDGGRNPGPDDFKE